MGPSKAKETNTMTQYEMTEKLSDKMGVSM